MQEVARIVVAGLASAQPLLVARIDDGAHSCWAITIGVADEQETLQLTVTRCSGLIRAELSECTAERPHESHHSRATTLIATTSWHLVVARCVAHKLHTTAQAHVGSQTHSVTFTSPRVYCSRV